MNMEQFYPGTKLHILLLFLIPCLDKQISQLKL